MGRNIIRLLNLVLLSFAIVILVSGCGNGKTGSMEQGSAEQGSAYQDIRVEELKMMIDGKEDTILLDVREQYEFDEGHIAGSILIPTGQITRRIVELDKNKTIVVICATGSRSAQVAQYLVKNGFSKVKNLVGGIMSWPYPESIVK